MTHWQHLKHIFSLKKMENVVELPGIREKYVITVKSGHLKMMKIKKKKKTAVDILKRIILDNSLS